MIASPTPVRFASGQPPEDNENAAEVERATPLPQYERTQSVPFTLNLQEDPQNPGQFQLVVNITPSQQPSTNVPLKLANLPNGSPTANDAVKSTSSDFKLYQTRQSSPATTPLHEKQVWSDLSAIPPRFLDKVVPDWNVTFSRSDSIASTQSKRLADIRARIKKKGKGYVVRLLKGSVSEANEIAEVDLGQQAGGVELDPSYELDSITYPAELDQAQAVDSEESSNDSNQTDVHEIGTSNEPGIQRQSDETTYEQAATDIRSIKSIPEENLSDAETLIPDVRSIRSRVVEDCNDTSLPCADRSDDLARSISVFSMVKTPTRGLSVVGPVRRAGKDGWARNKNKTVQWELKRSDAHKSVKRRPPRGSTLIPFNGVPLKEDSERSINLRKRAVSFPHHASKRDLSTHDYGVLRKSSKLRHTRRLSADDTHTLPGQRLSLRLQTNVARPKSANTSPIARRKSSPKKHQQNSAPASPSSPVLSTDSDERQGSSTEWIEIDPSHELREALGRAFKHIVDSGDNSGKSSNEQRPPQIIEPDHEEKVREIPLPSEVEIIPPSVGVRNSVPRFWGLAIIALAKKMIEGLEALRDISGVERPIQPGRIRVRWKCLCGENLYDDFIEMRPNAARLLEAYLNRPRNHTPRHSTSQSSSLSSIASIFDASNRHSPIATPSSTYDGSSSWSKKATSSQHSPTLLKINNNFGVRMNPFIEESWLLTCANEGKLTPKIVHLDVSEGRIKSDKDLAIALRQHYDQINQRWFHWARLRGLTTIEFVQFELHRNRFADIRATPSMPPKAMADLTSSLEADAPSQHPYTFEPVDLLPPVGPNYLLHLFKHPNDYDGELITYLRSPKRRTRLEFGMGWGIHLVEDFLPQKIWAIVMAICGLTSLLFAIMWTILKHDVQSAFGVAQWVLGLLSVLVIGLQSWLE